MERKRNKREEVRFIRNWWSLNYNHSFLRFDVFIVREMGYSFHTKRDLDRVRRPAFLEFRKRKLRRSASLMYRFRCVNQKPHKEGQSHTGQNIEQGMLFDEHGR